LGVNFGFGILSNAARIKTLEALGDGLKNEGIF
jgi:hypothetical protein